MKKTFEELPPPDLMRVPDAAAYLSISVKTMWMWIYHRKITSYRIGRLVRIKKADLDAVIEEGKTPAREEERW